MSLTHCFQLSVVPTSVCVACHPTSLCSSKCVSMPLSASLGFLPSASGGKVFDNFTDAHNPHSMSTKPCNGIIKYSGDQAPNCSAFCIAHVFSLSPGNDVLKLEADEVHL